MAPYSCQAPFLFGGLRCGTKFQLIAPEVLRNVKVLIAN